MKRNKGITLVALVITIIILVILAGITISQLVGSEIFKKAQLAEQKAKEGEDTEKWILADYENKLGEYVEGTRDTVTISRDEYEQLKNKINQMEVSNYKVLYENEDGWNSGSISIEGIQNWKQIGIYVPINNVPTKDNQIMLVLNKSTKGSFYGSTAWAFYDSATSYGMYQIAVSLSSSENTLQYGNNMKSILKKSGISDTNDGNQYNRRIYKIVGISM